MERRDVLRNLGLAAGACGLSGKVFAEGALANAHQKHANMTHAAAGPVSAPGRYASLSAATAECLRACEVCIAHCQALLAKGDTMLGECLKRCLELQTLCEATNTLANYGSDLTARTAKVCLDACLACAESCKPHVSHHQECKACYEACLKCAEECKKAV
jgi:Cys-rich four helix bundle protein (predicted Tat secretion target)